MSKDNETKKKKVKVIIVIIILILLIAIGILSIYFISRAKTNVSDKADTIIYGNIYTGTNGTNTVEAVGIKDGKYIYVGNRENAKKYTDDRTKVLKYKDGMVLSGPTDTHTHVTMSFETANYQIDLNECSSKEECIETIKKYIKEHPNEEMYVGMGWNYSFFENDIPTKDILDSICADKPIYIRSHDAHACWINSKMLELTGVTKDTENPIGGIIKRDKDGNSAGCFIDTAMDIYVKPHVKPYTVEQYKNLILQSQELYASIGYTAYMEIFIDTDETNYNIYRAYEELDKEGKLKLRVQGAWNVNNNENCLEEVKKAIRYKEESKGGMFELTDIKLFMDGVTEATTAYMSEPYADDNNTYGADRWPDEQSFKRLVDCIVLANKNDIVAHFHAIGDAAVTKALDAVEMARKQYINKNVHNVMTHLEVVKESDIPRFANLDIVVAANLMWGVNPEGINPDDFNQNVELRKLGKERYDKSYPYKSIFDAGATLSMATDYPPGALGVPSFAFYIGISRSILDIEETARGKSQALTREETLKIITYGGAYQMRQNNIRGTIEVGKQADLIVSNTNVLTCNKEEALLAEVLLTMVNGKTIYTQ